ncbi:Biosynthetic Aromatic amino acid aminotransferase alpha [Enhygromyxa salina]|uniref:Biosynthetic Aromatic amino acid aminotransferase alpha n=1 Tax=Enhygromyxa salina TaxID=215803 RepID=A0A0C2CUB1_9BACT|nr:pyridoxal phosphate-dependent aminotransferase [Enhygromyxa salina]KIG14726.1 Biosynthetic Aromatic amino acid aminotransferase alpha [Enhygromyxa salina]
MTEPERDVLSSRIADCILGQHESWTRRMFELGRQLRADGGGPIWDLSLGNPSLEPPQLWAQAIVETLRDEPTGMHRYMTNSGFLDVREFIAQREGERYGIQGLEPHDVTMTVGAAGAINVLLKSIVDDGDRVLVPAPFFSEYEHYCANHGATLVPVATNPDFSLDLGTIAAAIAQDPDSARILLINSPNNPTGTIYSAAALDELAAMLGKLQLPRPLWVIEDSPYRDLVHDQTAASVPSMLGRWPNTVLVTSHSKDLGLAGERIGYLVINPEARGRELLHRAVAFCNRTLGFVNAPALMQRVLPKVLGQPGGRVEVQVYAENCHKMAAGLRELGFEQPTPQAGFFLFPRLPASLRASLGEGGDVTLTHRLREQRALVVPGVAFGVPDHLRLAMCVDPPVVDGALNAFRAVCA